MGKPRERAPNDKIKKKGGKRPRLDIKRQITAKLREELSQKRRNQEPNAAVAAEEQVEAYTVDAFSAAASTAGRGLGRASQALRERRVEHPDRDLEVDEPPAYPTEEAGPSIHSAPSPGENTERIVLREIVSLLGCSSLTAKGMPPSRSDWRTKMLNAVDKFMPSSAKKASACAFKSASMRMLIFVVFPAIVSTPSCWRL